MTDSTERFGYEWAKYSGMFPGYEDQFRRWITPLKPANFRGKVVLDAGCGMGRNGLFVIKYGAESLLGIDYDKRTVAAAKKNLKPHKNAAVRYQSIYDLPEKNKFDIAFSIGVVHHLENPQLAVAKLARSVKKGGRVHLWLYGREGNGWIVWFVSPLRAVTSRLPTWMTEIVALKLSVPLYLYLKFFPVSHPYLKQLSAFPFAHLHSIVLDHLLPRIARYYSKKEAEALLKDAGLVNIHSYHTNHNSWSVIGTKK